MNVIFDIVQQSFAAETRSKAEAKDELARLRALVDDQQRRLDSLTLAAQAMWELLRAAAKFTDADLLEKMQEVDLRDGEADGKITSGVVNCPSCGRRSRSNRRHCVYCGAGLPTHAVFAKE